MSGKNINVLVKCQQFEENPYVLTQEAEAGEFHISLIDAKNIVTRINLVCWLLFFKTGSYLAQAIL